MSLPTVDEGSSELSVFRNVFPRERDDPYTKQRTSKISRHRTLLNNALFLDLLLTDHIPGIKASEFSFNARSIVCTYPLRIPLTYSNLVGELYPPKSQLVLQALFKTIMESNLDRLKQFSFIYYILKDFNDQHARKYASRAHIPPHFCSLMDGMWALDNFDLEVDNILAGKASVHFRDLTHILQGALRFLTDPAVTPNYQDKILSTLLQYGNASLAITFVEVAQPSLLSDSSISTYFNALKSISVESAFFYQRSAPQHLREDFLRTLIDHCLTHKKEENAMILINLPLDAEEQMIFDLHVKSSNIPTAKDTLLIKHIHQGLLAEALPFASSATRSNEPKVSGTNWSDLARGISLGMGPRTQPSH